ncbi:MAG: family 20 glycosylhydrolase [Mucilaginibacter polytrichastri]|nr:family 20 glycosylhydrolase [Mucilaginibacter polytrichastri]
MRKIFTPLLLSAFLAGSAAAQQPAPVRISVIPKPRSMEQGQGAFMMNRQTKIVARGEGTQQIAGLFNAFLQKRYGFTLQVDNKATSNIVVFNTLLRIKLPDEGYQLKADTNMVSITGMKDGVFYGAQTLLQLISQAGAQLSVPVVTINDHPTFSYRGMMLDCGRHFIEMDEIKKMLDVMAYLKMNRLHWHLTEDQGWRLEIKKYPKLTQIGAWRDSTIIGQYYDFKPFVYEKKREGGFYTQDQAREIVKYAADRNIIVIPEIEMPGHATAALAAYPELGNGTGPYGVMGYWGVHPTIFAPKEETFRFLQDVLTEVMAIFPSKYIHIGGDEAPKDEWKASAFAQKVIKKNKLKDEHGLQSYFIQRIEKFLNKNGRNLIGWDEILEGGLAPNATVMSWRGEAGGIAAARQNHDVIMAPNTYHYLDYAQSGDKDAEPLAIGGNLPLEKVYSYKPLTPDSLTAEQQKHIIGVQANIWTEYIATPAKLEYMLFPRILAVAESAWTPYVDKNYQDFSQSRLPARLNDLEKIGVNFRVPEADVKLEDLGNGKKRVTISPFVQDARVYYTIDGHKPDNTAARYTTPFETPAPGAQNMTLKYTVVTPGERSSNVFSVELNEKK